MVWLIAGISAAAALWIAAVQLRRSRRAAAFGRPVPPEWLEIIERNVPLHARLPEELRGELYGHMQVFLQEKQFHGCDGLDITDEMRVTIAAHACMLLLNRPARYFPNFSSVFVYPSSFVAEITTWKAGIEAVEKKARLGESWHRGPVVLAWDSVMRGAFDVHDGHNVTLHEFAHKLDEEYAEVDGVPLLNQRSRYLSWARVMSREFELLRESVEKGQKSVMDHYGADKPAEFFAVATEAFFEKSKELREKHPPLYDELRRFYNLDPASW